MQIHLKLGVIRTRNPYDFSMGVLNFFQLGIVAVCLLFDQVLPTQMSFHCKFYLYLSLYTNHITLVSDTTPLFLKKYTNQWLNNCIGDCGTCIS